MTREDVILNLELDFSYSDGWQTYYTWDGVLEAMKIYAQQEVDNALDAASVNAHLVSHSGRNAGTKATHIDANGGYEVEISKESILNCYKVE